MVARLTQSEIEAMVSSLLTLLDALMEMTQRAKRSNNSVTPVYC